MLQIAVVGAGWAGTRHVQATQELDRKVKVRMLVDPDEAHLAAAAAQLGVERCGAQLQEALDDAEVHAVSICSPHRYHCEQAMAAAAAGKHVLVEKPMAMNVAEATQMLEAADRSGVCLYVAENASYTPMARALCRIVAAGEGIGELTGAIIVKGFRAPVYGYQGRRAWLSNPKQGGPGTWTLHGVHTVGQLRYILGEVQRVFVQEHKASSFVRRDLEGTMTGLLTLENGVNVNLMQTAETKLYDDLGGYVLHGDRGSIRAGEEGYRLFTDSQGGTYFTYPENALSSYALEVEAFADYVESGVEGPTTGLMERRSVAIVQAGYESAATGQPVDLVQRFGAL